MTYNSDQIKFVQQYLDLMADGIAGPRTQAAVRSMPIINNNWKPERQIIAAFQFFLIKLNYTPGPIDGYYGPSTEYAWEDYQDESPGYWRDEPLPLAQARGYPTEDTKSMIEYYGKQGENQTRVLLPYEMTIAWAPHRKINSFLCHEQLSVSIKKCLSAALDHYGLELIQKLNLDQFGGCLNVRKKRGSQNWSTHSWGAAIDINPTENKLKWGRDKARAAEPAYSVWWKIWEDEGWVSLGREKNYDWMHVQAAHLK